MDARIALIKRPEERLDYMELNVSADDYTPGRYLRQPAGYRAFMPNPLPERAPFPMDEEMQVLLSEADRAIGRLDAVTEILPNPDMFVGMYVRKEAVYSSQIEGTQASLTDLLEYEAEAARRGRDADVHEVVNYIDAMNYGLDRLSEFPLSLRLFREIHEQLLEGVRGGEKEPGRFRSSQNWIGPPGIGGLSDAMYVPPPPDAAVDAMGDLEGFIRSDLPMPVLIKCGLAHAQFETIHPFLDGNGRLGRLLITFMLVWQGILQRPLLYISHYFRRHRDEYYHRLQAIRDDGDWSGWMRFFLRGVREVSLEATETAREILQLREEHRQIVGDAISNTPTGLILLDKLFERPTVNVNQVADIIDRSYPVANDLVARFEDLGLLREYTGQQRNRAFAYQPYMHVLARRGNGEPGGAEAEATEATGA